MNPDLRISTCARHPDEHLTGFCASCLRERLAGLDPATSTATLHNNSTSTSSALKSIFKPDRNKSAAPSSSSALLPELRRCKSFSGGRGDRVSVSILEPKRKSCDVRVRSTLSSLFNLDDQRKGTRRESKIGTRDLGFFSHPVTELKEEEEEEEESADVDEIRVLDDVEERITEIEDEFVGGEEIRTMKDHIEIDLQTNKPHGRDLKEIAGSFWLAASVFSKKLQKWRRKQKGKRCGSGGSVSLRMGKKGTGTQFRETQSEVGEYGFGRRSCDTDPRFSLDARRMSFDDPRCSWDEPRASWDGHLVGRMFPRMQPMVSVVEDVPAVQRFDYQIPVEELMDSIIEDEIVPGGTSQTRDYYAEDLSLQRRRRSLDRSSSIGRRAASMVTEVDEMKSVSNAKVSPATGDYFHGAKVLVTDCNLTDSKSNSVKDSSESFDSASREAASVVGGNHQELKKSQRWSKGWNIWGLIHRRNGRKNVGGSYCRENMGERSLSGSWPELRREVSGKSNGTFNRKDFHSNSSVSSRRSSNFDGLLGNRHSSSVDTNGHSKKRREDIVLERNRSTRYSPSSLDNGLLRFYLTPLRSSRSNSVKTRSKSSSSIARSVLRFY